MNFLTEALQNMEAIRADNALTSQKMKEKLQKTVKFSHINKENEKLMVIIHKLKTPILSKTQKVLKPVENTLSKEYYLMRGNGGIVSKNYG